MKTKELIEKKMTEIREYARRYKIPKYSRMRKDELIEKIVEKSSAVLSSSKSKSAKQKSPKGKKIRKLDSAVLDKKTAILPEITEAEARLKMKEAFSSSQAAQKKYHPRVKPAAPVPKPHDKFATGELPFEYKRERITLMVIDPNFFYVYWEVTDEKLKAAQDEDEKQIIKVLKILDTLLEKLPEAEIDKFAESDDFTLYDQILERYKI